MAKIIIFVLIVAFKCVFSEVIKTTKILNDLEDLVCDNNEVVSYFKREQLKTLSGNRDYKFTIKCTNISSCNEKCQWNTKCEGKNVYVRGIKSLFDPVLIQRQVIILCCNGDKSTTQTECLPEISATAAEYEITTKSGYAISMMSTNTDINVAPWIKITQCKFESTGCNDRVNPIEPKPEVSFEGFSGLSGLAGLSDFYEINGRIQRNAAPPAPTPTTPQTP